MESALEVPICTTNSTSKTSYNDLYSIVISNINIVFAHRQLRYKMPCGLLKQQVLTTSCDKCIPANGMEKRDISAKKRDMSC